MKRLLKLIFGRSYHVSHQRVLEIWVTIIFGLIFCAVVSILLYQMYGMSKPKAFTREEKPNPWSKSLPVDTTPGK